MHLTHAFNLKSKSKRELSSLYCVVFNRLADPSLTEPERRTALVLLHEIRIQLGL